MIQQTPGSGPTKGNEFDNANRRDPARKFKAAPPNMGRPVMPTVHTFQGIVSTIAKTFRSPDEALKHSLDNARYMRNDIGVMECLEQRMRSVALLDWHIEVDGPDLPHHKALQERMTNILRATRNFTKYRYTLSEAIWYGRYAIQHRFGWKITPNGRDIIVDDWLPINGDKLVFRQDDGSDEHPRDEVGIRVGSQFKPHDLIDGRVVVPTEAGLATFLAPHERSMVAIHKYLIEDAAYESPLDAGSIHGVGIRSRIYWEWFQKQEMLGLFLEFLERAALGFEIWYYPEGNDSAYQDVKNAAENRNGRKTIVLFPKPLGDTSMAYGVEHIEPNPGGIEAFQNLLNGYFGHRIKRYILGQVLTSEAEATGMGSGVADLHLQTMLDIVKFDATNLEETITRDLLKPLKIYNDASAHNVDMRFVIQTQLPDVEAKLAGMEKAWNMGARLKESDVLDAIGAAIPEPDEPTLQNPQATAAGQQQMAAMQGQGGDPNDPNAATAPQGDLTKAAGMSPNSGSNNPTANQLRAKLVSEFHSSDAHKAFAKLKETVGQDTPEINPGGEAEAEDGDGWFPGGGDDDDPDDGSPSPLFPSNIPEPSRNARGGDVDRYGDHQRGLWDEDKHPRDADGKFGSGGGSSGGSRPDLTKWTKKQWAETTAKAIAEKIKSGETVYHTTQMRATPLADPAHIRAHGNGLQIFVGGKQGWLDISSLDVDKMIGSHEIDTPTYRQHVGAISDAKHDGIELPEDVRADFAPAEKAEPTGFAKDIAHLEKQNSQLEEALERGAAMLPTLNAKEQKQLKKQIAALENVLAENRASLASMRQADTERNRRPGKILRYARWVTIGAHEGDGGTPVLIDDNGHIHAGPKNLTGQNVSSINKKQPEPKGKAGKKPSKLDADIKRKQDLLAEARAAIAESKTRQAQPAPEKPKPTAGTASQVRKALQVGIKTDKATGTVTVTVIHDSKVAGAFEMKRATGQTGKIDADVYLAPGIASDPTVRKAIQDEMTARAKKYLARNNAKIGNVKHTDQQPANAQAPRERMRGQKVDDLSNQLVAREAEDWGVDPEELAKTLDHVYQEKAEAYQPTLDAIAEARKQTGLTPKQLAHLENTGGDAASVPGLDDIARRLASSIPELGIGRGYEGGANADDEDLAGRLWDLLRNPPEKPSKTDPKLIRQAAEILYNANKSGMAPEGEGGGWEDWGEHDATPEELDAVPFARRGDVARYEWDESKHPRAADGKFGEGGGATTEDVRVKPSKGQKGLFDGPPEKPEPPKAPEPEPEPEEEDPADNPFRKTVAAAFAKINPGDVKKMANQSGKMVAFKAKPEQMQGFNASVRAVLNTFSPKSAERISKSVQKIEVHSDTLSVTRAYAAASRQRINTQNSRIGGYFAGQKGELVVPLEKDMGDMGPASILAHELGHAIDFDRDAWERKAHILDAKFRYSESKLSSDTQWQVAYQDEIKYSRQHGYRLSEYANKNASEGFAEYARFIFENEELAKEKFPKCYAFWQKHGLIGKAQQAAEESKPNQPEAKTPEPKDPEPPKKPEPPKSGGGRPANEWGFTRAQWHHLQKAGKKGDYDVQQANRDYVAAMKDHIAQGGTIPQEILKDFPHLKDLQARNAASGSVERYYRPRWRYA